jgi:membrane protein
MFLFWTWLSQSQRHAEFPICVSGASIPDTFGSTFGWDHLHYLRWPSAFHWADRLLRSRVFTDTRSRGEWPYPKGANATKSVIINIWDIWRDIEKKNLPLAAAGIAYYLLLSVFPALTVLSAVVSYLPVQNGLREATSVLGYVIPPQVMTLIRELLARVTPHRAALLSFGLVTTLWLASIAFKGLILGLDMVHGSNVQRPLWVSRILALALTIGVGVLLLIGVVLTSIGPSLWFYFSRVMPSESLWWRLGPYLKWSVSAFILFTAIELLYALGPSLPVSKRRTIPGAIAATVIWLLLAWGLGFYFHHFGELKFVRFFGFLAVPALFMTWLYCSAATILLGAEINSRLRRAKDSKD